MTEPAAPPAPPGAIQTTAAQTAAELPTGPTPELMVRLWDSLADSYDQVGVDFFAPSAAGLVEALDPRPGERVVDLGCGRGAVLLPMAQRVGATGAVLGGDLSPGMLAGCETLVREAGLTNTVLRVVDAQSPDVTALLDALGGPADLVSSSLVVFFLPDPATALGRWVDLLRPGGRLGISTFGERSEVWTDVDAVFDPYLPPQLLDARTSGAVGPFESDAGVEAMLAGAGYEDARSTTRRLTVRFTDPEHWHRFTMSVGQRLFWSFVPEDQRAEVRAEAFSRLSRAAADDGSITVWQDLRYTLAVRP